MKYEILNEQGEVINTIIADATFVEQHYQDQYRELPEEPTQPVIEPKTTLTKLEYMNRFTDAELAAIYTAAKTVIAVEVWLEKFKLSTDIELTDPRTVSGVQALEDAGLLAEGRADEILKL